MRFKGALLVAAYLMVCLVYCENAFGGEKELINSAKKIVVKWEKLLSKGGTLVSGENGVWGVYRSSLNSNVGFDIQKTNSIISPYLLIISAKTKWDHNFSSANADVYSEVYNANFGFKAREKALACTSEYDFGRGAKRDYNIMVYYAYQDGHWISTKTNSDFIGFINEDSSAEIKKEYYKLKLY